MGGVCDDAIDAIDAIDATDVDDKLKLSGRAADVPTASCLAVSPGVSKLTLPSSADADVISVGADNDDEDEVAVMGGSDRDAGDVMLGRGRGRDVDDGRDAGGCAAGSFPGCDRLMIRAHVATLMFIWL